MLSRVWFRVISLVLTVSLVSAAQAYAFSGSGWQQPCGEPHQRLVFDGTTRAAWSRTWHGPNAFLTPLCAYNIPRYCSCAGASAGAPCQSGIGTPNAGCVVEPAGFDRLGLVPNDLDVGGALPVAQPSR